MSVHVVSLSDPLYQATLAASALLTILAWAAWIYFYRRPEQVQRLYTHVETLAARTPLLRLAVTPPPHSAKGKQPEPQTAIVSESGPGAS